MITDVDEWLHPIDVDDSSWADEVAFTAADTAAGLAVHVTGRVTPNQPDEGAAATWALWQPVGPLVVTATASEIPPHNWDVMTIGPIGFRMEQARRRWTLHLDTTEARAFLSFESADECVAEDGGYTQPGTLRGDLVLAGTRLAFDGTASRSHRWGVPSTPPPPAPIPFAGPAVTTSRGTWTPTPTGLRHDPR